MNAQVAITRVTRRVAVNLLLLGLGSPLLADDLDSDTAVVGTVEADTINVIDPQTATANTADDAADTTVDDSDIPDGENDIDVSVNAGSDSTGIDALGGDDTVDASSTIDSTADATAGSTSGDVTGTFTDSVAVDATSNASSASLGINAGNGSDNVTNSGVINSNASTGSTSRSVATTVGDPANPLGFAQSEVDAGTTAIAQSTGIQTDTNATRTSSRVTSQVGTDGLQVQAEDTATAVGFDDSVTNSGDVTGNATAISESGASTVSLVGSGSASAITRSTSSAGSRGIATGAGSDTIDNSGAINLDATARSSALNSSISAGQVALNIPGATPATSNDASSSGNASALGIDTEGANHNTQTSTSTTITATGLTIAQSSSSIASVGNDSVDNSGAISVTSNAASDSVNGELQSTSLGPSSLTADSSARAESGGISTGGGDDAIGNVGAIASTAMSDAGALAVTASHNGFGTRSRADANVNADASAVGISADGSDTDTIATTSTTIDENGLTIEHVENELAVTGDDAVSNSALIEAMADAVSGAAAVPIAIDGSASSELRSSAIANAEGVDAGGGNDMITSSGGVSATSTASATAVGVAFGQSTAQLGRTNANVDTEVGAHAIATGIAGDSGVDRAATSNLSIGPSGMTLAVDDRTTAVSGNDVIVSSGPVSATSDAASTGVSVAVSIDNSAIADVSSTALSRAEGIMGGGADDNITSDGVIDVDSTATAVGVTASVGQLAPLAGALRTNAEADVTADALAVGITGDGGVGNRSMTYTTTIDDTGVRFTHQETGSASAGNDVLANLGDVLSTADATSGGGSLAVMRSAARSSMESSASATARGLDGGAGSDSVSNSGALTTSATSLGITVNAAVSTGGGATANGGILGGGTTAESDAVGISSAGHDLATSTTISADIGFNTGSVTASYESVADDVSADGADSISNSGDLTTSSTATTAQGNLGGVASGLALAIGRTRADAHAGGIESGNDDDTIDNEGDILSDASSTAIAANVAVAAVGGQAVAGNTAWDGGTRSTSSSTGIDADSGSITTTRIDAEASANLAQVSYEESTVAASGNDSIVNSGNITANAQSLAPSATGAMSAQGIAVAVSTSTADADATGIRGGDGDDVIDNSGDVTSDADSVAATANVSVTPLGAAIAADAVWDGGTTATSTATGIAGDGGNRTSTTTLIVGTDGISYTETSELADGSDIIANSGNVTVTSDAVAASGSVAVAIQGVAVATATSTADSSASAIDAGGGDSSDEVFNSGDLSSTANATAAAISASFTNAGLSVSAGAAWDGGSGAQGQSRGIDTGDGTDTIVNTATVTANSNALAAEASLGISVTGVAGATATSSAGSDAIAIDAGDDDAADLIDNAGDLFVDSDATAFSASASITTAGVAVAADTFWDGGTSAGSYAAGIAAGGGADVIDNSGDMDIGSSATSISASLGIAVQGVAAAVATSTAESVAAAIDAGNGDDMFQNSGVLGVDSGATAAGVSVALTGIGVAGAGDTFFEGGTRASAAAGGAMLGRGNDVAGNAGTIAVDAEAGTSSDAVSLTLLGVSGALIDANADADGSGIDGGDGNDILVNDGGISASADADAVGRGISISSFTGLADVSSRGHSTALGMSGGSGDDRIENNGSTTARADSSATGQSIGGALVGATITAANADSLSIATGLAGDAGDDTLLNTGMVTVDADAATTARAINAQAAGYALNNANSNATASATGMSGGDGDDTIVSGLDATVGVNSLSNTESLGVAVTIAGASDGEARTLPSANATGLAGGDGDDGIQNDGSLLVNGRTESVATGAGASAIGFASAKTSTAAETIASGIDGGAGADLLVNTGTIRVGPAEGASGDDQWMALIETTGFSAGLVGSTETETESTARTTSVGMDGGDDDDMLSNSGAIDVSATARNESTNSTLNLIGAAGTDSESGAIAHATGLDGGAGSDFIESLQSLAVSSQSSLVRNSGSAEFTLVGTNASDSGLIAGTTAVGIFGDVGADTVVTQGDIAVSALSTLDANGGSTTIAGTASASGTSGARTRAAGIDGGADDDIIVNEANLDVDANAALEMDATSYGFAGTSGTGGSLTADTTADGIIGGLGADDIRNSGTVDVRAKSDLDSTGNSSTTFGGSAATSESGGRSAATGIDGGDGNDVIVNDGVASITVLADADIRTNATSTTFAGGSSNDVVMTGDTTATGIAAGAGNDAIESHGDITVDSRVTLIATGGAKSTIDFDNTESTGSVRTTSAATGFDAGSGNDVLSIGESGSLLVRSVVESEVHNTASSDASIISRTTAGARAESISDARGVSLDDGDNMIQSSGIVTVAARSNAYGFARANGASVSLSGDATANTRATATAGAAGVTGAGGNNVVVNDGNLSVNADATTSRTLTIAFEIETINGVDPVDPEATIDDDLLPDLAAPENMFVDGNVVFWTQSGISDCSAQSYECVDDPNVGPDGGYYLVTTVMVQDVDDNGDPVFDDDGNPVLVAELRWEYAGITIATREETLDEFPSVAAGNGKGVDGDGRGDARGTASATAAGVSLGDGDNLVINEGDLDVAATSAAEFRATSSGTTTGDATSVVRATSLAGGTGIELGDGNNTIWNTGAIGVGAVASALTPTSAAAGGGFCINFLFWRWCGGEGTAVRDPDQTLVANVAGVIVGNGNNFIVNDGMIDVQANTFHDASASGRPSNRLTLNSEAGAIGIDTGDGDNVIENNGSITVLAVNSRADTVSAIGVRTGSGNDTLINNGLISATTNNGGTFGLGTAIDVGDGDDQVTLGDGSETIGNVILGDGDDTLTLAGNPLVHDGSLGAINLPGGAGTDTLVLQGPGTIVNTLDGFERAIKNGGGTFTLPALATVESLTIDGGILELNSDYTFANNGLFTTYIDTNGDRGQLLVNGLASIGGAINIEKRGAGYVNDDTLFTVVDATDGIVNSFTDVTLPDPIPLLSFELLTSADAVNVRAFAPSFGTVTVNPLYRTIADNLYGISGRANDDFSRQLGALQAMTSGFDRAFASVSPDSYQALTTNTISIGHQTTQLLRTHLSNARAVRRDILGTSAAYTPLAVSYRYGELRPVQAAMQSQQVGAKQGFSTRPGAGQSWASAFAAHGDYDVSSGRTQIDYESTGFAMGVDYALGDDWLIGAMFNRAESDTLLAEAVSEADVDYWGAGVYASRINHRDFVEGGIFYSESSFDSQRELQVGTESHTALSHHSGESWLAYLGAGRLVEFASWYMEPYATLYYFDIEEDPFEESGADSLNFLIGEKSTSALLGEAGTSFVRLQDLTNGAINWHASVAYNYDFEIADGEISYAYAGVPDRVFIIPDRNLTSGSVVLGAGLSFIRERSVLSLDYRRQFNDDFSNDILGARLSLSF